MALDIGADVARSGADAINDAMRFATGIYDFLESILKRDKDDKDARRLFQHLSSSKDVSSIMGVVIKDFSAKEYEEQLSRLGVPFKMTRVTDGPDKGANVCLIRDKDAALALAARQICFSHAEPQIMKDGSIIKPSVELSPSAMNMLSREKKTTLCVGPIMNEVKAKYMMEECRQRGISYSVRQDKERPEHASLIFMEKDKELFLQVLHKTELAFAGKVGQYDYLTKKADLENIKESLAYVDRKDNYTKDAIRNFFVVSANNVSDVIAVTPNAVAHNGIVRKESDFIHLKDFYKAEVWSMKNPIILSSEEYMTAKEDKAALKDLVQSKKSNVCFANEEDKSICYTQNILRSELLKKMYYLQAESCWNIDTEKKYLQEVIAGQRTLEDYMVMDTFEAPDEEILSWNEEDKIAAAKDLLSTLDIMSDTKDIIAAYEFNNDELKTDIDSLLQAAKEKTVISEAETSLPEKAIDEVE